jgi:hypothetical protein
LPKIPRSQRTVQPTTARFTPPSTAGFGASGRATQQLGRAVSQFSGVFDALGQAQEKNDRITTDNKVLDFIIDQDQQQFDAGNQIDGDGADHTFKSSGRHQQGALELLNKIPETQRDRVQLQLKRNQLKIQNQAQGQQLRHQEAFHVNDAITNAQNIRKRMVELGPDRIKAEAGVQDAETGANVELQQGLATSELIQKDIDRRPISERKKGILKRQQLDETAKSVVKGSKDPAALQQKLLKLQKEDEGKRPKGLPKKTSSRLPNNAVGKLLQQGATKGGVDPSLIAGIVNIESRFNPKAKNPHSSARGLFQFINATGRRYGLKNDGSDSVQSQISAGIRFTRDNINGFKKRVGRNPTPGEVYLAHFAGLGKAVAIGRAPDNAKISSIMSSKAIAANGSILRGKTVGQVKAWAERKMGGNGKAIPQAKLLGGPDTRHQDPLINRLLQDDMQKALAEQVRKQVDRAYVSDVLGNKREFNENNADEVKLLDGALKSSGTAERISQGDDELLEGLAKFSIKQRHAPKQFIAGVAGLIRSNDPKDIAKGYTVMDQIGAKAPLAFERSADGKKFAKEAETYRFLTQDRGKTAEEAIQHIQLMRDPEFKKGRELRMKEAKSLADDITTENFLDEFDDHNWFELNSDFNSFPNAGPQIMDHYKRLFIAEFVENGGDAEMAKKEATRQTKVTFGPTNVLGRDEIMRLPPEQVYGSVKGSTEYIGAQLKADLAAHLGKSPDEINADDVFIRADRQTLRELTGNTLPTYKVMYRDENGRLQTMIHRWAPDKKKAASEAEHKNLERRKLRNEALEVYEKVLGINPFTAQPAGVE